MIKKSQKAAPVTAPKELSKEVLVAVTGGGGFHRPPAI
jgi:hypothetical protein